MQCMWCPVLSPKHEPQSDAFRTQAALHPDIWQGTHTHVVMAGRSMGRSRIAGSLPGGFTAYAMELCHGITFHGAPVCFLRSSIMAFPSQ